MIISLAEKICLNKKEIAFLNLLKAKSFQSNVSLSICNKLVKLQLVDFSYEEHRDGYCSRWLWGYFISEKGKRALKEIKHKEALDKETKEWKNLVRKSPQTIDTFIIQVKKRYPRCSWEKEANNKVFIRGDDMEFCITEENGKFSLTCDFQSEEVGRQNLAAKEMVESIGELMQ